VKGVYEFEHWENIKEMNNNVLCLDSGFRVFENKKINVFRLGLFKLEGKKKKKV
jgi:hypothetical protein